MVLNGRLYVDHFEAAAQPGAGDPEVPGLGDASQSAHDPLTDSPAASWPPASACSRPCQARGQGHAGQPHG